PGRPSPEGAGRRRWGRGWWDELGRAARIRGGTLGQAERPLLPRDSRVHGDPPVEVDPAPRPRAAVARAKRQLQHVGMLAGEPMDQLLLFFREGELDRLVVVHEISVPCGDRYRRLSCSAGQRGGNLRLPP